jgi:hypothetical protein
VEWCENTIKVLEKDCGLENYWIEIKVHKLKNAFRIPRKTNEETAT